MAALLAARAQLGRLEMYCAGCRGHVIRKLRGTFLWVLVSGRNEGRSRMLDLSRRNEDRRTDHGAMEGARDGRTGHKGCHLHTPQASSAIFFQKAGEDWTDVWLRVLSTVKRSAIGCGCWDGVPRRANRGPCRTSGGKR